MSRTSREQLYLRLLLAFLAAIVALFAVAAANVPADSWLAFSGAAAIAGAFMPEAARVVQRRVRGIVRGTVRAAGVPRAVSTADWLLIAVLALALGLFAEVFPRYEWRLPSDGNHAVRIDRWTGTAQWGSPDLTGWASVAYRQRPDQSQQGLLGGAAIVGLVGMVVFQLGLCLARAWRRRNWERTQRETEELLEACRHLGINVRVDERT